MWTNVESREPVQESEGRWREPSRFSKAWVLALLCHYWVVWPWPSHFTSLSLQLKVAPKRAPSSGDAVDVEPKSQKGPGMKKKKSQTLWPDQLAIFKPPDPGQVTSLSGPGAKAISSVPAKLSADYFEGKENAFNKVTKLTHLLRTSYVSGSGDVGGHDTERSLPMWSAHFCGVSRQSMR